MMVAFGILQWILVITTGAVAGIMPTRVQHNVWESIIFIRTFLALRCYAVEWIEVVTVFVNSAKAIKLRIIIGAVRRTAPIMQ